MGHYNKGFNRYVYKVEDVNGTPTLRFNLSLSHRNQPLRILYADDNPDQRKSMNVGTFVSERLAHMAATTTIGPKSMPVVNIYTLSSAQDFMDLFKDPEGYLEQLVRDAPHSENEEARRAIALKGFLGFGETQEGFMARMNAPDQAIFDLVFLDIRMSQAEQGKKDYSGLHALRDALAARNDGMPIKLPDGTRTSLKARFYGFPIVFLTGYNEFGADLTKPKMEGVPPVSEADGFVSKPLVASSFKPAMLEFLDGKWIHPELGKNFLTDDYKHKPR
ncbi:hypothetical protein HYU13_03770 [Candidatus Woesearchaeota archaeon]|nr:hypothetical protein [Candidatus Woesearchaeota archaeon]